MAQQSDIISQPPPDDFPREISDPGYCQFLYDSREWLLANLVLSPQASVSAGEVAVPLLASITAMSNNGERLIEVARWSFAKTQTTPTALQEWSVGALKRLASWAAAGLVRISMRDQSNILYAVVRPDREEQVFLE